MKHLITLFLLFSHLIAFTQNAKIDSLQREVNIAKGTKKIIQLNELAHAFWEVDLTKSIKLGNEALRLSEQYNFFKNKAQTYNIISGTYFQLNNLKLADIYCDSSLNASKKYGDEATRMKALSNKILYYSIGYKAKNFIISTYLNDLLELCRKKGEYDFFADATRNVLTKKLTDNDKNNFNIIKYLESLEENADNKLKPVLYMLYSTYYNMDKQFFKAIEMLKKTLELTNDKFVRINCYELLGNIYCNIRRFKEGQVYYLEALKICDEFKDNTLFSHKEDIYFYLSMLYVELQDYKQAYKYATIPRAEGFGEYPERTCFEYYNLGNIYLGLDSLKKAEYYVNKSLLLSDSINLQWLKMISLQTKLKLLKKQSGYKNLRETIMSISEIIDSGEDVYTKYEAYQQLVDYYKYTSDYKKSLYYFEKWAEVNDTIKNRESIQVFNEFQTKYETEKKEQQIVLQENELKSKNHLLLVSSISGVAILIALIIIVFLYYKRNQAYKHLVLQSIKSSPLKTLPMLVDTDTMAEIGTEVEIKELKSNQLTDRQKKQLFQALTEQLSNKVYLQPDINITKLAEYCKSNRTYLSQIINEHYCLNFNAFINKYRIDEAMQILIAEYTHIQLKTIYERLGFKSYTVFNDAFKKNLGVTPAIYLRTLKNMKMQ